MAMPTNPIGAEILRDFTVQHTEARFAASAADPGFGVGDEVLRVDQLTLEQRHECQQHCGRIAPGVGDQASLADRITVTLGQTVDRIVDELGAGVRHTVPAFPRVEIAQAEISG